MKASNTHRRGVEHACSCWSDCLSLKQGLARLARLAILGYDPLGMAPPVPKAVEDGMRFFRQMHAEARWLDRTRPVTLVGVQGGPCDWLAKTRPKFICHQVASFVKEVLR